MLDLDSTKWDGTHSNLLFEHTSDLHIDLHDSDLWTPYYASFHPKQSSADFPSSNAPCSHPGELCVDAKLCACVSNGTLCQAACRCETVPCESISCNTYSLFKTLNLSLSGHRRRKGCQCKKTNCQKASCPCFRANRECDPEICTVCNVRCVCYF